MKICESDGGDGHVMTETIFAGEQVIKFSLDDVAVLTAFDAEFARFPKNFFVRHGPCHAGDGYCKDKKPNELGSNFHVVKYWVH